MCISALRAKKNTADGRRPAAAVTANKQNETGRSRHSRLTTVKTDIGGRSQHVHFARSAKYTSDGGIPVTARGRQTITNEREEPACALYTQRKIPLSRRPLLRTDHQLKPGVIAV